MTPTGQIVFDSIQIFFMYMYSGNLSAGENGRALGVAFAGEGIYYERDTITNDIATRTARYYYSSNDGASVS